MGAGRDEVCEKADPLTAALNQYRLVIGHVSGRREAADAGKGLRVAVDERERDRLEVGREVTRRRALVGVARELQLPPLDDVAGLWEAQTDATRWIAVGIAARVIEVQVGIDHPADVGGGMPELRERIFELGTPVLPFVHDAVDVLELLLLLVAEPRVHKHEPVVVLDQEAAQRQRNAVALVGRNATLPQRFRHDPEHGAAVEGLAAGLERVAGEAADAEGGVGHQRSERGTRNAEPWGRVARALTPSPLFRVPTSAFRIRACRGLSCTSISCSRFSTPRSRARPISARRTYAVARASPKARWRAGFSMPKNAATWSSPR